MKRFVDIVLSAIIVWLLLSLHACTDRKNKVYRIGLSQCMTDDAWRQAMIRDAELEILNYDNIELVVRSADSDPHKQEEQINELIDLGVDVLIISPLSSEMTPIVEKVCKQGVKVIVTDRKVNTDCYSSFIAPDNYEIGYNAGIYASKLLNDMSHPLIMEVWGSQNSSPAFDRHNGFLDALRQQGIQPTFYPIYGEWHPDTALVRLRNVEDSLIFSRVNLIYCHNDMMGIATRNFLDAHHYPVPSILGVDAVPGAGLEAVADGRITASFLYSTGGAEVIQTAYKLINGENVQHAVKLRTAVIDQRTAQTMLLQTARINDYQKSIIRQQNRIQTLNERFSFLRNSLATILFFLCVTAVLLFFLFRTNKTIKKRNAELREKNRREEEQSRKLIAMNAEIKHATSEKINFFTDLSHEIRTPLTLVVAPLPRIKAAVPEQLMPEMEMVEKNATRLLKIVNQMLDLQRIESGNVQPKIIQQDFIPFIREVKMYFDGIARINDIDYSLSMNVDGQLLCPFDKDLIEKVFINLLSNAFKYTPQGGRIHLSVSQDNQQLVCCIEDSGPGIPEELRENIFERFCTSSNQVGTGIGLHLVKKFVLMHGGDVTLYESALGGAAFRVCLPLIQENAGTEPSLPKIEEQDALTNEMLAEHYDYHILVVDDNEDIRFLLQRELRDNFNVTVVSSAEEALAVLDKESVSLVLSDVVMQGMNGYDLCKAIRSDLRYCHIPVLLLTALNDESQRIFGTSVGADGYIQKPFHIQYLKVKIIRCMENRRLMRAKMLENVGKSQSDVDDNPDVTNSMDDKFLKRIYEIVEHAYPDINYNVERISEELHLSRGHFARKLKELTGTTPVEFLRNYRLKKATELLLTRQYAISEVVYKTGFSSPAYFSKCFKDAFGKTPTEYIAEKFDSAD